MEAADKCCCNATVHASWEVTGLLRALFDEDPVKAVVYDLVKKNAKGCPS
jgi:hypothetical protein